MNYTDEQLRRIDALVEHHIMGHDVEWHWCIYDDETVGGWREAGSVHADYKVPANSSGWRFWPCYATDSAPHTEFSVVDNYTTDHNAVAEMRKRLAQMHAGLSLMDKFINHLYAILYPHTSLSEYDETPTMFRFEIFDILNASPLQQCLAALAACGVDVEQELKEVEA